MSRTIFAGFILAALAAHAVPQASNVTVAEATKPGQYRVSYSVDSPAVVMIDILVDGQPIDALTAESGTVCGYVPEGTHSIVWNARATFGSGQEKSVTARVTTWAPGAAPDYLVVDLRTGAKRFYAKAADVPNGVGDMAYKTDKMILRRIHAAGQTFRMGQPLTGERCSADSGEATVAATRYDDETAHAVGFTSDYYIGIYEVTQRQYWNVTGLTPSGYKYGEKSTNYETSKGFPVENVSYETLRGAVTAGIDWPTTGSSVLSTGMIQKFREKADLATLDLPTEAQWEFACRAGTTTSLNNGLGCSDAKSARADANAEDIAWYFGNANVNSGSADRTGTREVGTKLPNNWGLYDMHGNVHEWCLDWLATGDAYRATFAGDWATGGVTIDPKGATSAANGCRVVRGGDYFYCSAFLRSAARACRSDKAGNSGGHVGFRLVCSGTVE